MKKVSSSNLDLTQIEALLKIMKKEKVVSFSLGDLAVNFSPMAMIDEVVQTPPAPPANTEAYVKWQMDKEAQEKALKLKAKLAEEEDLFYSSEQSPKLNSKE